MATERQRSNHVATSNVIAQVAVAVFVIATLYWARAILIPFALAVLLTFVLTPLVLFLQRHGLGRVPSLSIVVVSAVLVIGSVGVVVIEQLTDLTHTLPDHSDRIKSKAA